MEVCKIGKGSRAVCKASRERIQDGSVRIQIDVRGFKCTLAVQAAAQCLGPVLRDMPHVDATYISGMEDIDYVDRRDAFKAFGVSSAAAGDFRKRVMERVGSQRARRNSETRSSTARAPLSSPTLPQSPPKAERAVGRKRKAEEVETETDEQDQQKDGSKEPASSAAPQLSAYELKRMEQIRRNQERMQMLQLPALATQLSQKAEGDKGSKAPPRGISAKRAKPAPPPPREGLRSKGLTEQAIKFAAGIAAESRTGEITLAHPRSVARFDKPASGDTDRLQPGRRQPAGDAPFESLHCEPSEDAEYIKALSACSPMHVHEPEIETSALDLSLQEGNVAKVVADGVTNLDFMPTQTRCVLAVSDKKGNVGLWMCDPLKPDPPCPLGQDGVLSCAPHKEYVSGLSWMGHDSAAASLLTCSYDGSVVLLDPERAQFLLVHADDEDEYSCMGCPDPNTALLGNALGNMCVLDVRQKEVAGASVNVHDKKVNCVHFKPCGGGASTTFVTAASDRRVSIWDLRKFGRGLKPVASASHAKSCHGAYFHPKGADRVLTTSYDDTVKIWDSAQGLAQQASFKHNNQTGRWITPFKAVWTPEGDHIVLGDMKRGLSVLRVAAIKPSFKTLTSGFMTAIPSRMACHLSLPVVAAATGSGRLHLWTA